MSRLRHHTAREAYDQGYAAWADGKHRQSNPYRKYSPLRSQWDQGYDSGDDPQPPADYAGPDEYYKPLRAV